jgi:hypothetical protein
MTEQMPAKLIKFRPHPLELIKICHNSGIKGRGFTGSAPENMFTFRQYPPFLNRQGESRAILLTRQDWFQIREQRPRHCQDLGTEDVLDYLFLIGMSQLHFPF